MSQQQTAVPPFLLLFLLTALLSMFAASFQGFMQSPVPVSSANGRGGMEAGAIPPEPLGIAGLPDGGASLALTEKQADELSELMRRLQANPQDTEALLEIGETFLMGQDWARAQVFLARAVASAPEDSRPRYMIGICLYQQGKMPEAAAAFEKLLSLKEDPAVQYNLAVIYKYHLNERDKAKELFNKIIASPEADLDTIEMAKKELQN